VSQELSFSSGEGRQLEDKGAFFETQRGRLNRIAYGILGSSTDAEDVVQEAYLRFELTGGELKSREAWLTTVVTRLAIDRLRSASHQREVYPGTWLPEPVVEVRNQEQLQVARSELTVGLLFVLEQLRPVERAVFLLRETFDIPYREVASIVERSETACRQMYLRARERVQREAGAFRDIAGKEAMVERYATAILEGDEQKLIEAVTEDVILFSDGGGKVEANLNPIYGVAKMVRFVRGVLRKFPFDKLERRPALVNGEPGLLVLRNGKLDSVLAFRFEKDRISAVYGIRNPDKLRRVTI
jgi:RNA polymerase sigma-70 factor (ECF subfamily)